MGQQQDTTNVVGYVRVSTDEQTVSALGLEAQRDAHVTVFMVPFRETAVAMFGYDFLSLSLE